MWWHYPALENDRFETTLDSFVRSRHKTIEKKPVPRPRPIPSLGDKESPDSNGLLCRKSSPGRVLTHAGQAVLSPASGAGVSIQGPTFLKNGARLLVRLQPVLKRGHRGCDWLALLMGGGKANDPRSRRGPHVVHRAADWRGSP